MESLFEVFLDDPQEIFVDARNGFKKKKNKQQKKNVKQEIGKQKKISIIIFNWMPTTNVDINTISFILKYFFYKRVHSTIRIRNFFMCKGF